MDIGEKKKDKKGEWQGGGGGCDNYEGNKCSGDDNNGDGGEGWRTWEWGGVNAIVVAATMDR